MLYHAYEMTHAAFSPMRAAARMGQDLVRNPFNPMAETYGNRAVSAALDPEIPLKSAVAPIAVAASPPGRPPTRR